ncbi:hypothetical protein MTO96_008583 [Rhipicephalus appendiculatus]
MDFLSFFVFYDWLFLAITIAVLLYLRATRYRNYWRNQNVAHEKFSLFFGPQMKQLYKVLLKMGKPVLYVAEPDLLKLILVKDSGLTQRKVVEVDDPVMRQIMFNVPPDQWKKLRTATSPAFTSGKLRKMQAIIDSCARLTSERLKKAATASEDVDMKGFYGHFSLDAVASCSFGVKLSPNSPEEGSFISSARNVFFAEVTPSVVLNALVQKLGHTFRKRVFNGKAFDFYKNATIDIIKKREDNNIGSSPSYDVVSKLPYLDCVVNETLRVMTPGARVDRVFHEDYILGETGIKVSKDCVVIIPLYSLHHDPEFFPEPDIFNPDRFSEENINSIRPYTFLPFGAGPRNCIGSRFAQQLVKTCLLHAVHSVQFVKCPKTKVPLEYRPGFGIMQPKDLVVGVRERSS